MGRRFEMKKKTIIPNESFQIGQNKRKSVVFFFCQIENLFDFVVYLKLTLQRVTKANFYKQKGFIVAEKNGKKNIVFF